jgi:Na+/H+ antiporter NhaD/arsenite permease-like protein
MHPSTIELTASVLFFFAILHTFSASALRRIGDRYQSGSIGENLFHLFGEVEVVFGLWAGLLFVVFSTVVDYVSAVHYIESLDLTEPAFVFVIMAVAATRPVIRLASVCITGIARLLPLPGETAFVFSAMVVGPLLGSFLTEPAAMTVTALLLKDRLFDSRHINGRLKYLALGTLFVSVSIGGVLTPFAAPPVLMVAKKWDWDFAFMMNHFGWKAIFAVLANAAFLILVGWKQLAAVRPISRVGAAKSGSVPVWMMAVHVAILALVVMNSHHIAIFMGLFLFFLAFVGVTKEFQSSIQLKESLLVGAFLAGLVVLGGMQSWWLQPLLTSMGEGALYLGCIALTAVTDNAALTFLGSQVQGLSPALQYAMVSGAVVGGGLTVIANAPNPAGYSILQKTFGVAGVSPFKLFLGAAIPTCIDMAAFWILPHISN